MEVDSVEMYKNWTVLHAEGEDWWFFHTTGIIIRPVSYVLPYMTQRFVEGSSWLWVFPSGTSSLVRFDLLGKLSHTKSVCDWRCKVILRTDDGFKPDFI